jgi:hypothetical protein
MVAVWVRLPLAPVIVTFPFRGVGPVLVELLPPPPPQESAPNITLRRNRLKIVLRRMRFE